MVPVGDRPPPAIRRLKASQSDEIRLGLDETIELESMRLTVAPPHVMVIPIAEEPDVVEFVSQESLGEDGVHGSLYTIRAVHAGEGTLRLGFRDLRSGEMVAEKEITLRVGD